MQWCSSSSQGLLAVRVLTLDPGRAATLTGIAFAAAGLATAAGSATYWRAAARLGLERFAIVGCVAMAMAIAVALLALAPSVGLVVAATALTGVLTGSLAPALAAMLGMETPQGARGTAFGWSGSATSIGIAAGPFVTGVIAAGSSVSIGLVASAAAGLLAAGALLRWGREPAAPERPGLTAEA